jgi:hypothetical protein
MAGLCGVFAVSSFDGHADEIRQHVKNLSNARSVAQINS